ncbi:MAG TPA: ABC transporter ATP-binding protein [Polyangiaceae bacterium]
MAQPLIQVSDLRKEFRQGLLRKRVEAVKRVSFQVNQGDIFGFLGPNGAGKTTTIKMLTGLISPTSGSAQLFGKSIPSPEAMEHIGFLPENPYVYPYLTPREFVEMCGRLSGVSRKSIADRTRRVLDLVGILYAADRPVRRLSKGMLQRTGLAAALVADPELLILDEPMSGLDPVGRKEVRDLILSERAAGRTIFFSTHILTDVETMCDQVTILRKGEVVVSGRLSDLLRGSAQRTEVVVRTESEDFDVWCESAGYGVERVREQVTIDVVGKDKVKPLLQHALDANLEVVRVMPRSETLENLFVREAIAPKTAGERTLPAGEPDVESS